MHEITLKGSYSEMGEQLGQMLRTNNFKPPPIPLERFKMVKGCEQALEEHAPTILEEIDSMVESGGFVETSLKAFYLALLPLPDFRCSVFAVGREHTSTGKAIFARNYDWDYSFQQHFTLFRTYPEGALASMSLTDLMVGRYGGINEAGLAIALTVIPGSRDDRPGVMLHLATQWILDNCKTVGEAVDFMRKIPHVRSNLYIVTDLEGNMVLIQATPERVDIVEPTDGLLVATNHFQTPEMKVFEELDFIPDTSQPRVEIVKKWFNGNKGKIDSKQAQSILRGMIMTGEGVCQDFSRDDSRFSTIWSWTYETGGREMQIADGLPSEVDYRRYTF